MSDLAWAIAAVLPSVHQLAEAAREDYELLMEAAAQMGVSDDAVQRMRTETPWDSREVRRRIVMGEGHRWER